MEPESDTNWYEKQYVCAYFMQYNETVLLIDISFATSQPEFLPTQIEKLWKAISANQEKIAIFCNNVTKFGDFV